MQNVYPKTHAIDMTNGTCHPYRWPREVWRKKTRTGWDNFKGAVLLLTPMVVNAAQDIGESIKEGAVEMAETVTSVFQTSWRVVTGVIKWAIPCLIILGWIILFSVLYRLGLLGGVGGALKDAMRWAWTKRGGARKEGLPTLP
jgi:hypothetical protein